MEARKLLDDDGLSRLKQQKRSIRLRCWVDRVFGMWRAALSLDPQTAVWVDKRIQDEVDRLFADGVPDDAPDDPIERQQYLAALAVLSLLAGEGARSGRPEVIVVSRRHSARRRTASRSSTVGCPSTFRETPGATCSRGQDPRRRDLAARRPDLGRSQRLASAAQRRVLRALYPTCAVPDCPVRFSRCKVHHVWWWEHGGPTDLDNLLPLCSRHHVAVHDGGWS